MADKPWKVWEREGSKDLGGTRSGPLGLNTPDCMDCPLVAPEFKYYKHFVWYEADWKQAELNAANHCPDKFPILAIKEAGRNGRKRVQMNWEDFVLLHKLATQAEIW